MSGVSVQYENEPLMRALCVAENRLREYRRDVEYRYCQYNAEEERQLQLAVETARSNHQKGNQ